MFDPIHRFRRPQLPVLLLASCLFGPRGAHADSAVFGSGLPCSGVSAVMPGAGIAAGDIAAQAATAGAYEFLASVRRVLPSRMRLAPTDALGMGGGEVCGRGDPVRSFVAALWRRVQAA